MSDDLVNVEIDGQVVQAKPGTMLIEVAESVGVSIPRFCYHKKLSVAANCRMCMVEVEKAPKPLPACATPVNDGMKVHTASATALAAQKGTMEFLLINHPLDCPICDQGGECELQDVAMGYGEGVSRYNEGKRVVMDKNIGPLVATEMTRCIHCTRCVRFGDEIAGMRELGATGRGENMEIGTYIEKSMASEMSGNVIDLCPVGALTAKPSRFAARAWEMTEQAGIAPHDGVGSNLAVHISNGEVIRVVPAENESINETWLSDRDRFSYEGVNSADRLNKPMIKRENGWRECSWETALNMVQENLAKLPADDINGLVSPHATLEEMYLAQKYLRALGANSVDSRLRQVDFSDQDFMPLFPWLGCGVDDLEKLDAALVVGTDLRMDHPIVAHRLRKSFLAGGKVMGLNPRAFKLNHDWSELLTASPAQMVSALSVLADKLNVTLASDLNSASSFTGSTEAIERIATTLKEADNAMVLIGQYAMSSSVAAQLRGILSAIGAGSDIAFGYLPDAGNTSGAWLSGCVPHRGPAKSSVPARRNFSDMFETTGKGYFLWDVEPEFDTHDPQRALRALQGASFVVVATPFASDTVKSYANVLLPISAFSETSGTYVNASGAWQSFRAISAAPGEARPGWKVLRVLGNLADLSGFDYGSSVEVRDELKQQCTELPAFSAAIESGANYNAVDQEDGLQRISSVNNYRVDGVVRRAAALQRTTEAEESSARMNAAELSKHGLQENNAIKLRQGRHDVTVNLELDESVPDGCVYLPAATEISAQLGASFGVVEVQEA